LIQCEVIIWLLHDNSALFSCPLHRPWDRFIFNNKNGNSCIDNFFAFFMPTRFVICMVKIIIQGIPAGIFPKEYFFSSSCYYLSRVLVLVPWWYVKTQRVYLFYDGIDRKAFSRDSYLDFLIAIIRKWESRDSESKAQSQMVQRSSQWSIFSDLSVFVVLRASISLTCLSTTLSLLSIA